MSKEDFQIDLDHVTSVFSEELEGLDIYVTKREIGNGPQFAVETYKKDESTQITESRWYTKEEFEAFCAGMKHLNTMFNKAEKLRNEGNE